MSIIIHFGPAPALHSSDTTPMIPSVIDETHKPFNMGPGLENDPDFTIMSADDSSVVDVSTTSSVLYSEKEPIISIPQQSVGTCFGLPYQDHNYGAPPPPTPPCNSPAHAPTVVETETVSIVTTAPSNEELHEISVTRCVCGFEHDDEYMICCDECLVWQHVDCMGLDRDKIPDTYLCEECEPRKVDRHKAKLLQAKKKVVLPVKLVFTETSEESEEDKSNQNSDASKIKAHRSSTRRKTEEETKLEPPSLKRVKSHNRIGKDGLEIKRSRFHGRTRSRSVGNCTAVEAEEEAQDAWKCSMEWPKKKPDNNPLSNQYSDEVNHLTGVLKHHGDDSKVSRQLQAQLCKVVELGSQQRKLVAVCDLSRDQMIIEFKGQFTSASLFHEKNPAFKQRLFPYVLFYKLRSNEELCVDATDYKADAKYVRRSCQPNAEVHHFVFNGSLHLYILSIKEIKKDEEITIPFDSSYNDYASDLICACKTDKCHYAIQGKSSVSELSERRRSRRKMQISTDEDSNQSLGSSIVSPTKSIKDSGLKSPPPSVKINMLTSATVAEQTELKLLSEDNDNAEVSEQKKKLTREERKLDAIMRAFDQMEKAAKRRQQALSRMANQKVISGKPEDIQERQEVSAPAMKEEKSPLPVSAPVEILSTGATEESDKSSSGQTSKPKKGKRRRGSGTSTRRRTRTNSGGSDIFTADETSACESTQPPLTPTPVTDNSNCEAVPVSTPDVTVPSPIPTATSPVFPKMKRFLHNEWLQEKVESTQTPPLPPPPLPPLTLPPQPSSCPLTIHTESSPNLLAATTMYVRCIKDSPSAGGISAAHLRRSSFAGHGKQTSGQGSAKKRWLRQAMYDCEPWEADAGTTDGMNGDGSPNHSTCFSPNRQSEVGSPGVSPLDDVITPLKKRRLMRKSLESLSSPKSPNAESTGASSGMSPDHSSCEPNADSFAEGPYSSESLKTIEVNRAHGVTNFVEKCASSGNGLGKHLLKSLREKWILDDIKTKTENDFIRSMEQDTVKSGTDLEDDSKVQNSKCTPTLVISNVKKENLVSSENEKKDVEIIDLCDESNNEISPKNESEDAKTTFGHLTKDSKHQSHVQGKDGKDTSSSVLHVATNPTDGVSEEKLFSSCRTNDNHTQAKTVSGIATMVENSSPSIVNKTMQTVGPSVITMHPATIAKTPKEGSDQFRPTTNGTLCKMSNLGQDAGAKSVAESSSSVLVINKASSCNVQIPSDAQKDTVVDGSFEKGCPSVNMLSSCSEHVSSVKVSLPPVSDDKLNVLGREIVPTKTPREDEEHTTPLIPEDPANKATPVTPRRKVSLSEYRQRKRDNPTTQMSSDMKTNNNCVLKEMDESLGEGEIKLAALPLFEKCESSKADKSKPLKNLKLPNESSNSFETQVERIAEHRENLTERLKREFGLDDESNTDKRDASKYKKHAEPVSRKMAKGISPILSLCTQLPPPPPPPSTAMPMINTNRGPASPFSYSTGQQQTPFIGAQISRNQFMPGPATMVSQPLIPIIHPSTSLIQPSCAYGATMHTSVSGSAFPPASNPTFTLPQRIPHMPLPPTYPPPFQSRVYK